MLAEGQSWTIASARRLIAEIFRKSAIESPELDSRILIGYALGLDHAGLTSAATRVLSEQEIERINAFAERRLRREPVARIIGRKEFWSLPLKVSAATLVPRPETETVVEAALGTIGDRRQPLRIADLGTGTGAILLALASELPNATGVGTDIDAAALATARENACDAGLQNRCAFILSDFGAALAGSFDLIVSNPPYIANSEISALAPEVRDFDPKAALDGGTDGLDCYRRIAADSPRLLKSSGRLVVEIGAGQAAAVTSIFEAAGLDRAAPPRPDLAGTPRALVFQGVS